MSTLARVVLLEVAQRPSKMIQCFIFIATDFGEHEGVVRPNPRKFLEVA